MRSVANPRGIVLAPAQARGAASGGSGPGARDPFTAGAHHRLDELVIRVLVAAVHQLEERLPAVGSIIVAAAEIKRSNRIVAWMDGEDAHDSGRRQAHGIADRRRLARMQVLAEPRPAFQPAGRKRLPPARFMPGRPD